MRGLRKVVAMNLPLPSGSSPPEKPPGSMTIWARRMAFSMRSMVSSMSETDRFFTTRISHWAPAFSKARAESTSQLVPGKAGMNTRGRATLMAGALFSRFSHRGTSAVTGTGWALLGKIFSKVPIQAAHSSSREMRSPPSFTSSLLEVRPKITGDRAASVERSASLESSTTKAPSWGAYRVSVDRPSAKRKPVLLPKHIRSTAAAAPPSRTTLAEMMSPHSICSSTAR